MNLLLARAEAGDREAQSQLGAAYYRKGDEPHLREAATWFRRAAEQGSADSQFGLGVMYRDGKGVAQDYREAARWFHRAAENGFAPAQSELGLLYVRGRGVQEDPEEAVRWFRKAAEQGFALAQLNLALGYMRGYVTGQSDLVQAYLWASLAEARGVEKASRARETIVSLMSPEKLARAQEQLAHWEPWVVRKGSPRRFKRDLVVQTRHGDITFRAEERPLLALPFRCPHCGATQTLKLLSTLCETGLHGEAAGLWHRSCRTCRESITEALYPAARKHLEALEHSCPDLVRRIRMAVPPYDPDDRIPRGGDPTPGHRPLQGA